MDSAGKAKQPDGASGLKASTLIDRYADFVIRYRWWLIVASLLASVWLISGARFLGFNNEYRVFFSEDNPHLQAFDAQQLTYTKNDNVLFVITPNEGEVFTREVLAAVEDVTREAWLFPFALRVDSVSNFQFTQAEGDELIVGNLVEDALGMTRSELALAKERALAEPFLVGQLLNKDASVTGVNITFQLPQKEMDEALRAAAAARELKTRIEAEYPVTVHLSGVIMLSNAFFEASMKDMATLIPAMYLVIVVVMFVLLRSIGATLSTVLVIFLSMLGAMGAAG